jgi:hypothetical protein
MRIGLYDEGVKKCTICSIEMGLFQAVTMHGLWLRMHISIDSPSWTIP